MLLSVKQQQALQACFQNNVQAEHISMLKKHQHQQNLSIKIYEEKDIPGSSLKSQIYYAAPKKIPPFHVMTSIYISSK